MKPGSQQGTRRGRRRRRSDDARWDEAQLEDFRRLIVGPEQTRLDRLETPGPPSPELLGTVLPESISWTAKRRQEELAISIQPVVTTAVEKAARSRPEFFGEILAPAIGAAVRKAVADALAALQQRFDELLERTVSVQGLQWRIEAITTGRPFGEVALLHTMVYRVEEVFLIHPGTGIVLEHVVAGGAPSRPPDEVASLLEAIDSFAREAFRPEAGAHLTQARVGDVTVWVDRDRSAVVAAVVRGLATRELTAALSETRERIALSHRSELARFESDVTPFTNTRPLLDQCLRTERRPPARRARVWLALAVALAAILGVNALLAREHERTETTRRVHDYIHRLDAQPGVAVTSVSRSGRRLRVTGLADPLANPVSAIRPPAGVAKLELRFEPFVSLEPEIVARRTEREQQEVAKLRSARAALENFSIGFAADSAVAASARLERAAALARQLIDAAAARKETACITITGHTDPGGTSAHNRQLSQARRAHVASGLVSLGIEPEHLRVAERRAAVATDGRRARAATFDVDMVPLGSDCRGNG